MKTIKKIVKVKFTKFLFFFIGLASTGWFLVRVIPKPSRASYPCMRAAAPFMSAFVLTLLALSGSVSAYLRFHLLAKQRRFTAAAFFGVIALFCVVMISGVNPLNSFAFSPFSSARISFTPNDPIGIPRGIYPGRVVWAHDTNAAVWDGSSGYWWSESNTPTENSQKMVEASILALTGTQSASAAWDTLFKHFNFVKHGSATGYEATEKIAIKVNMNNATSHDDNNQINGTPSLIYALVATLVEDANVPQNNIIVTDPSRFITNNIYTKCTADFPDVVFEDYVGGEGRTKSTYVDNAIPFSIDNGTQATGIATCMIEATYIIDMAQLKGHIGQGVTLSAKNLFGATSITSDAGTNINDLGYHTNFNQDQTGKDIYLTFTDFLGHKDLGEKTVLFMIDALYGCEELWGTPVNKFQMAPFNGHWTASLFVSQDGVAIDAVGIDFLTTEFPDLADAAHCDKYLVEAAQAPDAPSGTIYDPERDGTPCISLGVLEHWNNATDKKYSGNLGTGPGIELIYVIPGMTPIKQSAVPRVNAQASISIIHNTLQIVGAQPGETYSVFDLHGKTLFKNYSVDKVINLQTLPGGNYCVRINSDGSRVSHFFVQ